MNPCFYLSLLCIYIAETPSISCDTLSDNHVRIWATKPILDVAAEDDDKQPRILAQLEWGGGYNEDK